jgi:membrane-associated progesterone receptor component
MAAEGGESNELPFGKSGDEAASNPEESGYLSSLITEIFSSPLNLFLVFVITILFHRIFKSRQQAQYKHVVEPDLPKLKKKDYTMEELRKFNGLGPDGRVLIAVNGNVFDVTKGKRFYGPGNR